MEDLSQKISDFLNNPDSMNMIGELLGSLTGQGSTTDTPQPSAESPAPSLSPDVLGMAMKFAPLLQSFGNESNNTRLLRALKPMLADDKQKKIDHAILFMQLAKVLPLIDLKGFLE